jgi:hypothetical protein
MKKAIVNRLKVARKKVSKKWYGYSHQKAVILSDDSLDLLEKKSKIKNLLAGTRKNISYTFEEYRSEKLSLLSSGRLSEFEGLRFSKTHVTDNTIQETYHTGLSYNTSKFDDLFEDLLNRKGVIGVALVFKLQDTDEEGVHFFASEYITKGLFNRIKDKGKGVFEHLSEKVMQMNTRSTQEFEIIEYYIRIIYEKSKKSQS